MCYGFNIHQRIKASNQICYEYSDYSSNRILKFTFILIRVKMDKNIPIFYISFEHPEKKETVRKLECKDKSWTHITLMLTNY